MEIDFRTFVLLHKIYKFDNVISKAAGRYTFHKSYKVDSKDYLQDFIISQLQNIYIFISIINKNQNEQLLQLNLKINFLIKYKLVQQFEFLDWKQEDFNNDLFVYLQKKIFGSTNLNKSPLNPCRKIYNIINKLFDAYQIKLKHFSVSQLQYRQSLQIPPTADGQMMKKFTNL